MLKFSDFLKIYKFVGIVTKKPMNAENAKIP